MSFDAHKNLCKVLVSTGYNASATSVVLASQDGAKLPAVPFNLTWWDATNFSDPADDPNVEIVRVTAITSDTLTITRGQEATTAKTHNTALAQYEMLLGITAKTLTDIESGAGGIVQTIRTAGSISSPFVASALSFIERGLYRPNSLIDPDFVLGEMLWNADPIGFLTSTSGTEGVAWNLANGKMNSPGTTDSNNSFTQFEARTFFQAPYFAIEIPILSDPGDGTVVVFTANVVTGIQGTSRRGIQLKWDRHGQTLGVYYFDESSTTTTIQQVSFTTPAVPFTLALTVACRSVTAQVKLSNGNYYTAARGVLPADGNYDLRTPANIAAFNVVNLQAVNYLNTGTLTLGNVRWGYLAGINGLADKMVKFLDQTPIQKGNAQFLINSVQHIAASSPEGAPTANFTIQQVDPTRRYVKTIAKIFVIRTVGGVQHIEGENSGVCAYDPTTDTFIYLIPNWGDYRTGGSFGPINTYVYRRQGFPQGVIVLTGGQVFSGLPTATSDYDPDLYDDGTLMHMVYIQTNLATNWTRFGIVHVTTPRATFGPASTWTQVAAQPLTGNSEGAKFMKIGGTMFIVATDNNAHHQIVFDFSLNQIATFAAPSGTPAADAHACMINHRDGANDRLFWLYFDNGKYDGFTGTWGGIHFFENSAQQVGHDFDQRTLLDVGT
jgi:hypothetical protein